MSKSKPVCPVCGFPELGGPPYDSFGYPTYEICPCCGVEFGNDDWEKTTSELRDEWVQGGFVWFSQHTTPPPAWGPLKQLKAAGLWSPLLPQDHE